LVGTSTAISPEAASTRLRVALAMAAQTIDINHPLLDSVRNPVP